MIVTVNVGNGSVSYEVTTRRDLLELIADIRLAMSLRLELESVVRLEPDEVVIVTCDEQKPEKVKRPA